MGAAWEMSSDPSVERSARVGEDLSDRPRFRDETDQTDVAATRWALERKLLNEPTCSPRTTAGFRLVAVSGSCSSTVYEEMQ